MSDVDVPIVLVLSIARLGEVGLRGWWRSHSSSQPGEYVLGGAFPRTWHCAALELDVLSAARRHNAILGRPTALHLFSDQLPFRRMAAAWLAERKTAGDHALIDRLASWAIDAALADLGEWVGEAQAIGEHVGPGLLLGQLTAADLKPADPPIQVAQSLAAAYLDQGDELHPPYFDLVP